MCVWAGAGGGRVQYVRVFNSRKVYVHVFNSCKVYIRALLLNMYSVHVHAHVHCTV